MVFECPFGKKQAFFHGEDNVCFGWHKGEQNESSLRSFGVSSMFERDIPEKIIQERSGHRSITALRVYEKTTNQQMIETSQVLPPESSTSSGLPSVTSDLPSTSGAAMEESERRPELHIFRGCTFSNRNFSFQK